MEKKAFSGLNFGQYESFLKKGLRDSMDLQRTHMQQSKMPIPYKAEAQIYKGVRFTFHFLAGSVDSTNKSEPLTAVHEGLRGLKFLDSKLNSSKATWEITYYPQKIKGMDSLQQRLILSPRLPTAMRISANSFHMTLLNIVKSAEIRINSIDRAFKKNGGEVKPFLQDLNLVLNISGAKPFAVNEAFSHDRFLKSGDVRVGGMKGDKPQIMATFNLLILDKVVRVYDEKVSETYIRVKQEKLDEQEAEKRDREWREHSQSLIQLVREYMETPEFKKLKDPQTHKVLDLRGLEDITLHDLDKLILQMYDNFEVPERNRDTEMLGEVINEARLEEAVDYNNLGRPQKNAPNLAELAKDLGFDTEAVTSSSPTPTNPVIWGEQEDKDRFVGSPDALKGTIFENKSFAFTLDDF